MSASKIIHLNSKPDNWGPPIVNTPVLLTGDNNVVTSPSMYRMDVLFPLDYTCFAMTNNDDLTEPLPPPKCYIHKKIINRHHASTNCPCDPTCRSHLHVWQQNVRGYSSHHFRGFLWKPWWLDWANRLQSYDPSNQMWSSTQSSSMQVQKSSSNFTYCRFNIITQTKATNSFWVKRFDRQNSTRFLIITHQIKLTSTLHRTDRTHYAPYLPNLYARAHGSSSLRTISNILLHYSARTLRTKYNLPLR